MDDDVWDLERQGWRALQEGRGPQFYDELLTADALMVVPGMVLDRAAVLASWEGVPLWRDVDLADRQQRRLDGGAALVTYWATAHRDGVDGAYRAACTSVYVRDGAGWQLAFHQQTPMPSPPAHAGVDE